MPGKVIHGHARRGQNTPEYRLWWAMIIRCELKAGPRYDRYGGRGIKVCRRWRESFAAFLEDMGCRPSPAHSIDRINNDGDYEPSNVRWATRAEQNTNKTQRRSTTQLAHRGVTMGLSEWSDAVGVPTSVLRKRLRRGWDANRTLTTPLMRGAA